MLSGTSRFSDIFPQAASRVIEPYKGGPLPPRRDDAMRFDTSKIRIDDQINGVKHALSGAFGANTLG